MPLYFWANDASTEVCRATFATVRLRVMPTLVVEFTAPTVWVFIPDMTKPPVRFARVDTSAKVPLYDAAAFSTRAVRAAWVLTSEASTFATA